ncbi:hypothetical protein BD410DRAFT_410300 [Rickenella mellea]|uniref:NAD(P)-binding protein n=1 Tax=Rickenella mellea TaxID=50990 RepID=A0A4Y7QHW5_9AGAM|nr:hypothetical protein BD410DRAFT_410300 [Rickenella mellea]
MSQSSGKPNAIIFGGLNTCSRSLAAFLVPESGEALVANLRIVDKYSVHPPTTYLGSEFPKILEKPNVEYQQANLTLPATVSHVFDPPEGQAPYTYVFDLTGEVRRDRPEMIHIQQTVTISRLIGLEAARRKVAAYVRLQLPFFETSEKGSHDEKENLKPLGTQGVWWQENLRVLAAIEGLNLAIVRIGIVYGPYVEYGAVASIMTVAAVYGHLKRQLKALWPPGKNSMNTVHVEDVAGGLWACAKWIAKTGRKEADILAGEDILSNDKSKVQGKDVDFLPDPSKKIVAPLFNLVDDANTTQLSMGNTVTGLFGTTFGFHDFITTTIAKFKLTESMIEEINEDHVGGWTSMITSSKPPVTNSPLSAYLDESDLSKSVIALNNGKIKNIVGYTLTKPEFNQQQLKEVVDKWKAEHTWPNNEE